MASTAIDRNKLSDLLYTLSENDIIDIPSGGTAAIQEMTGQEQRNFMNRTKLTNGTAIQELLSACVLEVDGETGPLEPKARQEWFLDMLSVDRRTLAFGIRRHSLGQEFQFSTQCPSCGAKETWEVNVSDKTAFPVTACPHGKDKEFLYESQTRPGLTFKVQMLDGRMEMAILRKRDQLDLLTDLEMRNPRVQCVEGDKTTWVPVALSKVPDSIISEMRRQIKVAEGNIRTTVKVVCKSCQAEVEFDLLQLPDFMTPSVTS